MSVRDGAKRLLPQISELAAILVVVGMTIGYGIFTSPPVDSSPNPPVLDSKSSQPTLRVEGYGDEAPTGVGGKLQNAGPVNQSGDVDQDLQDPGSGDSIQPNSGLSSLEGER